MFQIEVTDSDIRCGKQASARWCAVALAARRLFGGGVAVDGETLTIATGKSFPLPPEAVRFVADFDHYRDVKPITFEV